MRIYSKRTLILALLVFLVAANKPALGQGGTGREPTKTNTPPKTTPSGRGTKPSGKSSAPNGGRVSRQTTCSAQSPTSGTGNNYSENLSGGVRLEMVGIPAGSFCMGSPAGKGESDEHPQHQVTVSAFYMGKYEVTQAQWRAVMGTNPSSSKGDDLPLESVSWDDAQEFCRKLSQMTGHEYRLPTEAEWEYAARAGTTGDYAGNLDAMGWYDANSGGRTHPVGQKQSNGFGLYDMHGNVWEWVLDWYGDYPSGEVTNPQRPGSGSFRVDRGGSWGSAAAVLRSANRYSPSPGIRYDSLGFRLVRTLR
jgi:formylglycine-generating enzyme required for sulfatase activity